jgi:hypothetical protein
VVNLQGRGLVVVWLSSGGLLRMVVEVMPLSWVVLLLGAVVGASTSPLGMGQLLPLVTSFSSLPQLLLLGAVGVPCSPRGLLRLAPQGTCLLEVVLPRGALLGMCTLTLVQQPRATLRVSLSKLVPPVMRPTVEGGCVSLAVLLLRAPLHPPLPLRPPRVGGTLWLWVVLQQVAPREMPGAALLFRVEQLLLAQVAL